MIQAPQTAEALAVTPLARPASRPRASLLVLALIAAAFVTIRGPLILRQPGGLDEEFYSVPGWAITKWGIPRAPHIPQRNPQRVFYLADQAYFVEPPLGFYWQALFFAIMPDTYAAARVASAVAALATIWLVYELGRRFYRDETAALWGAGLYSLFRTFYFPAMTGRPDMLCTALGLAALLCLWTWHETRRSRLLVACGALLGLGGLTHPFALVYALQSAGWMLLAGRGWRRCGGLAMVVIVAVAVFSLWLPLILAYPEAFRGQFLNHVHSGPGLVERLVWPWKSLTYHAWMMSGHLGPAQYWLLLGGALVAAAVDVRGRSPGPRIASLLAWSAVYLLSATAGVHPTQFYWCFPTALLCVCLGRAITQLAARIPGSGGQGTIARWTGGALLIGLMLPGLGLRTWLAHLRHWDDVNYNAPAFARRILDDLPADARYTVGREFVLDFLAADRPTILADTYEPHFTATPLAYDYLVVSRHGIEERVPGLLGGELVRRYGEQGDLFACYAEVYRARAGRTTGR